MAKEVTVSAEVFESKEQTCADCGKVTSDTVFSVSEKKYRCTKCGGMEPDYSKKCYVCGRKPVVPLTGMCGVCTFGESDCRDPKNW